MLKLLLDENVVVSEWVPSVGGASRERGLDVVPGSGVDLLGNTFYHDSVAL